MYKIILVIVCLAFQYNVMAQFGYKTIVDEKKGGTILVGEINEKIIDSVGEYKWFTDGVKEYKPDSNKTIVLKKNIAPFRFVVFAGTWCEDTQNLLPKLYKTLNTIGFDKKNMQLFGVDRDKHALNIEHELYKINFVPTIIVYRDNREVARIVENVNHSIESDLIDIITKDIETFPVK